MPNHLYKSFKTWKLIFLYKLFIYFPIYKKTVNCRTIQQNIFYERILSGFYNYHTVTDKY